MKKFRIRRLIKKSDIDFFSKPSTKRKNDKVNKKREKIIEHIINEKIPKHYYRSTKWECIKKYIDKWIQLSCIKKYKL